MLKLITIENEMPIISPEVRTFAVFRKIIERDRGKYGDRNIVVKGDANGAKKTVAMLELAFIYFYCDPRSSYVESYANNPIERAEKIKKRLGLPDEWTVDKVIEDACEVYLEDIKNDFDVQQLEASISAAQKTKDWLKNVDYSLVDNKGKPVYDPLHVSKVNKEVGGVIENLKTLRKKVLTNEVVNRKIRGDKEGKGIGRYEGR